MYYVEFTFIIESLHTFSKLDNFVANKVHVSALEITDPEVIFSEYVPIIVKCNVTKCNMYDALNDGINYHQLS